MMKENCWDHKNCVNTDCPARSDETLDGIHGGRNGGRACWAVAGTLCIARTVARYHRGGDYGIVRGARVEVPKPEMPMGIFAKELRNCLKCDFYHKVEQEEGSHFLPALTIFERTRETEKQQA